MSLLEEAIQSHFDNGAFAQFNKIDNFNGGTLEIPENILTKKEKLKCVYEVDNETVIIYLNGIKEKTVTCPNYACRPLVSIDMIFRMTSMGYMPFLLKVSNGKEDVELNEDSYTRTAADLLDSPDRKSKTLENKLYKAIDQFFEDESPPVASVKEGFDIIHNHYDGELNELIRQQA